MDKKFEDNQMLIIATKAISWVVLIYGCIILLSIGVDILKDALSFSFSVIGLSMVIGGLSALKRNNWGRLLIVNTLLLHIPLRILSTKIYLPYFYTDEHFSYFGAEIIRERILEQIIRDVSFCCVFLSIAFFFVYPKIKEQFK